MGWKFTPFRSSQTRRPAWLATAFFVIYVANAVVAYEWTVVPGGLAVFWLNNGLVAASLLLLPASTGLAVAVAALATDVLCGRLIGGAPWPQSFLIGSLDFSEAWVASVLIRKVGGASLDLTQVRRFGAVILRGVLPATLLTGTVGTLLFKILYGGDFASLWASWAIGDFLGMSISVPAALIIARFRMFDQPKVRSPLTSVALEIAVSILAIAPLCVTGPPLAFVVFPVFLVAAFCLTPPYAAGSTVFVTSAAAIITIAGFGPFATRHPGDGTGILKLQLFLACVVFTLFLAQGSLAERARSQARLQRALTRISRGRARAEGALRELEVSEARFRLLAENASDVISRYDPHGNLSYVSPSAREVYGYEPEELLGRFNNHCIHPDDLEAVLGNLAAMMAIGEHGCEERMEFRAIKPSGEVRWIESSPRVLRDAATGKIIELQSISRDVTSRKALEEELEARRLEAEASSVAKSQFLANMSHEIRTPLNGVIAMADLLARSDLKESDRRIVEIIRSSGDSLNRLLSDILDLSRIEAGRVELEWAPFRLGDAVRSAVALCALHAQEKGILVDVEVAPEANRPFQGDEVRIRQIVTNLVSNAVKFTLQGEVCVRVTAPPGGNVRIEVQDTGVGFDPDQREQLFDRFQQADGSITRRFGGTGLGLPISRQLAEAMGGILQCDSRPGEGSCFWFEAPLIPADDPEVQLPAEGEWQAASGGRVLVVDDHPTNRTVAELILRNLGFEVATAENGAEAVAAFESQPFDLVLMDMQMPVMDGLTAVRRIRALEAVRRGPRLPILMLSANALPEHALQSREAGADGHVAKPITAASLMSAINAVVEATGEATPGCGAAERARG